MNDTNFIELSKALRKIVWQFGSKGVNGECCEDLSMSEFLALEKAADTWNCSVQTIGNQLGFTKSGATRIVNRLEKKGYIQKIRSHEDSRVCCVVLTENGREILETANRRYAEQLTEVLSKMPEDKACKISESLSDMARALRK